MGRKIAEIGDAVVVEAKIGGAVVVEAALSL